MAKRIPHRQLWRQWQIKRITKVREDYPSLSIMEFFMMCERKLNPNLTDNPKDNFGKNEGAAGFLGPLYLDSKGRVDLYARRWVDREQVRWDLDPENITRLIYRSPTLVTEEFEDDNGEKIQWYGDFIKSPRGKQVDPIAKHMRDTREAIERAEIRISESKDARRVKKSVDEKIIELEAKQDKWDREAGRKRRRRSNY